MADFGKKMNFENLFRYQENSNSLFGFEVTFIDLYSYIIQNLLILGDFNFLVFQKIFIKIFWKTLKNCESKLITHLTH